MYPGLAADSGGGVPGKGFGDLPSEPSLRWTLGDLEVTDPSSMVIENNYSMQEPKCHESRTHLSLDKDCPKTRPILPRTAGKIVAVAQLGGLHHRYERRTD